MSELVVGSIAGLAANSYEIDIASSSTLDLSRAKAGSIPKAALPSGSILQVVSTTKTDTFSASVATTAVSGDVTGLTASITPQASSSKILVSVHLSAAVDATVYSALYRDGSIILRGDAAGSRQRVATAMIGNAFFLTTTPIVYLDSPASTSSLTYSVRLSHSSNSTVTVYVNRGPTDTDNGQTGRYASTITLMEVAA